MMQGHLRPTLLVFTLGEDRESTRRRLLPRAHGGLERRLHRACLEAALDAGRRTGCRLEVAAPADVELPGDVERRRQHSGGFATRLHRALRESFAVATGPVVLVGGDVPGLAPAHLQRTLTLLAEDPERVVLGPSPDGGFYLLATARPLDAATLGEVRWCCRQTLVSLEEALGRAGREVLRLPQALVDLDRRADLERWLAGGPAAVGAALKGLADGLRRLLADLRQPVLAPALLRPSRVVARPRRPRGPPASL